jgi:hypothetical protein
MDRTQARIKRYREQSGRYRESATAQMRAGHWDRVEEFLWGSLVGAVKAVAASRGDDLKTTSEMRAGHWDRVEEFLWGSLVGAVKAVAASRGDDIKTDEETRRYVAALARESRDRRLGDEETRRYAAALARESRDRRLGDAFEQVSGFANTYLRVLDSRLGPERLYLVVERVGRAVETLWGMLPLDEETD